MGVDLACFFTETESGADRYVLIFKRIHALVGTTYEPDVFVTSPINDRVERARRFT